MTREAPKLLKLNRRSTVHIWDHPFLQQIRDLWQRDTDHSHDVPGKGQIRPNSSLPCGTSSLLPLPPPRTKNRAGEVQPRFWSSLFLCDCPAGPCSAQAASSPLLPSSGLGAPKCSTTEQHTPTEMPHCSDPSSCMPVKALLFHRGKHRNLLL